MLAASRTCQDMQVKGRQHSMREKMEDAETIGGEREMVTSFEGHEHCKVERAASTIWAIVDHGRHELRPLGRRCVEIKLADRTPDLHYPHPHCHRHTNLKPT